MKTRWIAIALVALMSMQGAYARGFSSGRSFSGGSFSRSFSASRSVSPSRSGFGSFRSTPAPAPSIAPAPADRSTSFGKFSSNGAGSAPSAPGGKSAMTSGLDQSAAQANALKNWDAKNAPPTGSAASSAGSYRQPPNAGGWGNAYGTTAGPAPVPPQTVVVHQSGGFGSNLMWFMLGRSLSDHHSYGSAYIGPSGSYGNQPAVVVQHESFGMSVLRIFAWLLLISIVAWVAWFLFFRARRRETKHRNYSL